MGGASLQREKIALQTLERETLGKKGKMFENWSGGKKGGNLILQKSWEKGSYIKGALS